MWSQAEKEYWGGRETKSWNQRSETYNKLEEISWWLFLTLKSRVLMTGG